MLSKLSLFNKHSLLNNSILCGCLSLSLLFLGCNSKQTASNDEPENGKKTPIKKQPENKKTDPDKKPDKTPDELKKDLVNEINKGEINKGEKNEKPADKKEGKTDNKKTENKTDSKTADKKDDKKNATVKNPYTKKIKKNDFPKEYKLGKDFPDNPDPKDSLGILNDLLISMVFRPQREQRQPDLLAALIKTVDLILASKDATDYHRNLAMLSRFKVLHMAGLSGDKTADYLLVKYANQATGKESDKITEWVNLAKMEHKVANAEQLKKEELLDLLAEYKKYLSTNKVVKLDDKYLRLAGYLTALTNRLDKKKRDLLFKEFGLVYAKSYEHELREYGQQLGKPPKAEGGKLIGQEMKLVGKLIDESHFRMTDHRGKVMIVDFWATWCGPCIGEIPNVKKILDKYADKNFDVIGVSLDRNEDHLKEYLKNNPLPWNTLYSQLAQQAAKTYEVRGIPSFFLIDKYGKIVAQANRVSAFEDKIDALLEVEYRIENDTSITKPTEKPIENPADSQKKPVAEPAKKPEK